MAATRTAFVLALNQMLDLKDLETGCHSSRLAEWAVRVAETLGMEEAAFQDVETAAILHDIGKIGVPDAVLRKPGALNAEEYEQLKKHSEFGWAITRHYPGLERVSHFILHHHERVDGKGYPGGLRAGEIPPGALVIAVIDAFDAMVSSRPYRKGLPVAEALRRLNEARGTQFDPGVVDAFARIAHAEMAGVTAAVGD